MSRILVVTGTDTEVGKTVLTAALAALASSRGQRVAVVKPVQTGVSPGEPGDLSVVRALAGIDDLHEYARFSEPLAPGTAARRAGVRAPSISELASMIGDLADRHLVLVEGAGGLLVELDSEGGTVADLAERLAAPVLVVSRAGLGTLSVTALTCRYLRDRGIGCLGVVIGSWPAEPDLAAACNLEDMARYAGEPLLGRLPSGAGAMSPLEFLRAAEDGLDVARLFAAVPPRTSPPSLAPKLDQLRRSGIYRRLRIGGEGDGVRTVVDGREVLVLCSNDYLGLRTHPAVRAAAAAAAERWGAGSGSSRLVSGNLGIHDQLERQLAEFKGHETCVLFGSGYLANTGVVSALAGRGDVILSDALNHASLIDGCRMSGAQTIVYGHCDLLALEDGLRRARGRPSLIVTDSVFSMDGDLAPLDGIVELARRFGARVLVDEAHATGVVGNVGRGLVAELGLERDVDVVIGTLSKALGSYGAFVCCTAEMREFLVNRARTLIFSTALPPPSAGAALEALRIVREQPEIVQRVHANALFLREELTAAGYQVPPGELPIVPLIVGDPERAMALCEAALRDGVFAQAIRPPTVPPGTSRLRLTVSAAHTHEQLRAAARVLGAALAPCG